MTATSNHATFHHAGYVADDSIDFHARYGRALHARAARDVLALLLTALRPRDAGDRSAGRRGWSSAPRAAACGQG